MQRHIAVDKLKASWVGEVLSKSQLSIGNLESASPQKVDGENTDFTTSHVPVPVRDASSFTGQCRPPIGYRRASL